LVNDTGKTMLIITTQKEMNASVGKIRLIFILMRHHPWSGDPEKIIITIITTTTSEAWS
jgi:hypothetical protein